MDFLFNIMRLLTFITVLFLLGCSNSTPSEHPTKTEHIPKSTPSYLKQVTASLRTDHIANAKSGFFLLADPIDALVARAGLMRKAEHTLDVQYYIYKDDLAGQILAYEMLLAADRGVRVRLLLDDLGSYGNDKGIFALNAHPNIEIRLFNAFSRSRTMPGQLLTGFGEKTRRMHNKALIADNQFSIIGGRNIGNEYFGANPDILFDDLDVLLTNPVTDDVSGMFDEFWNSRKARDASEKIDLEMDEAMLKSLRDSLERGLHLHADSDYAQAIANSTLVNENGLSDVQFDWAIAVLKADNAEKIAASRDEYALMLAPQMLPLVDGLSERFIMVSPYFVPGDDGVEFFRVLRQRDVEVIIITNSLASNDVAIVHSGYAKYRRDLLEMGVKLYEVDGRDIEKTKRSTIPDWFASRSSLHAKFFIFDDTATFIGSFNFDPRSYYENTEVGVAIYSNTLSVELADELLKILPLHTFEVSLNEDNKLQWQVGEEVFNTEPGTGWFKRTLNVMMGWLPVESEL
ncbi:phospholipase D family protein [Thaumasiovibrio subtropicus]|uniref:phospholipase D family protein n=1 Tax=Thaumasiovibrio subtropicus TaxID=1891207 RepID=UPI000B350DF6|nr:phospholipase D family protein [Thaumasiovibrio subtropicus]